jgi:hypothetical protein
LCYLCSISRVIYFNFSINSLSIFLHLKSQLFSVSLLINHNSVLSQKLNTTCLIFHLFYFTSFYWYFLLFMVRYFIEYNALTSIVCTWISQWFLAKKNYFSRIISQELIIASLFIIKAILNPLSATYVQGIFQHNFQCKNVHTILNKICYFKNKIKHNGQILNLSNTPTWGCSSSI